MNFSRDYCSGQYPSLWRTGDFLNNFDVHTRYFRTLTSRTAPASRKQPCTTVTSAEATIRIKMKL